MTPEDRIKAMAALEAARNNLFEAACFSSGIVLRLVNEAHSAAKLAIEIANERD